MDRLIGITISNMLKVINLTLCKNVLYAHYPLTLPYITALGYPNLIIYHHQLLPPPRDILLVTRLRHSETYPIPLTKTKRFCSFINYALANYV